MSFSLHKLPSWTYKFMLVLAAAVWGLGTVALKDSVGNVPPPWIVGLRFTLGGLVLLAIYLKPFLKHVTREALVGGSILGLLVALSYLFNGEGLALVGNLDTFSIGYGDAITLASAFWIGLHLVFQAKFSVQSDAMTLTTIQFIVAGIVSSIFALFTQGAPDMQAITQPAFIRNILYLAICAGCISLSLQNIGLAHVPAGPASLLLATESVFGVIFSILLLGEVVTPPMLVGFVLISASIVVSETFPLKKKRLDPQEVSDAEMAASL